MLTIVIYPIYTRCWCCDKLRLVLSHLLLLLLLLNDLFIAAGEEGIRGTIKGDNCGGCYFIHEPPNRYRCCSSSSSSRSNFCSPFNCLTLTINLICCISPPPPPPLPLITVFSSFSCLPACLQHFLLSPVSSVSVFGVFPQLLVSSCCLIT